jgi:hypothetical protein
MQYPWQKSQREKYQSSQKSPLFSPFTPYNCPLDSTKTNHNKRLKFSGADGLNMIGGDLGAGIAIDQTHCAVCS